MAYVDESALEEEDLEGGSAPLTSGAPMASGSTMQADAAPSGSKQKTPGRFADLSEYLRVNAPQEFGTQLAGKVGEDIDKGQENLNSAQTDFKERADANTIRDTQGLTGQVGTAPESVNVDDFAKLRDAEYKGPSKLSDTPDLYNRVQGSAGSAVGKANASKTEGGRFALLDNYYGRPNYSQGQKSLDNLLVQNDPKSQQSFDTIRDNAAALQKNVNEAGVELGNYGAQAKGTTQATRKGARDAVGIDDSGNKTGGGAIGSLETDVQGRLTQRTAEQEAQRQSIIDALTNRDLSNIDPQLADVLNLNDVSSTWGADGSQYLSNKELTAQNVATKEQERRMAALARLGNIESSLDETLAGTMDDEATVGFDRDSYLNQVGDARNAALNAAKSHPSLNELKVGSDRTAMFGSTAPSEMKVTEFLERLKPEYDTAARELAEAGFDPADILANPNQYNAYPQYYAQIIKTYQDEEGRLNQAINSIANQQWSANTLTRQPGATNELYNAWS